MAKRNFPNIDFTNRFSRLLRSVRSQMSCAVLSHYFNDRTCARESTFFVQRLVARATQSQNNHINYEFNKDLHNSLLMSGHEFTLVTDVENRNAHDVLE